MTPSSLKALLRLRNLKQRSIAERIGCHEMELSQTINGRRVNPEIRRKFAEHLGMVVEEIFDEEFDAVVAYLKGKRQQEATA